MVERFVSSLNDGFFWNEYVDDDYHSGLKHTRAALPVGTILEVDRVYIRSTNKGKVGKDNFDSVTFRVLKNPAWTDKKHPRFWAKLDDVNQIEFKEAT